MHKCRHVCLDDIKKKITRYDLIYKISKKHTVTVALLILFQEFTFEQHIKKPVKVLIFSQAFPMRFTHLENTFLLDPLPHHSVLQMFLSPFTEAILKIDFYKAH